MNNSNVASPLPYWYHRNKSESKKVAFIRSTALRSFFGEIYLFIFKYLFDCPGLSCSVWDLVFWPAVTHPSLGAWSLSHSTTREVPFWESVEGHIWGKFWGWLAPFVKKKKKINLFSCFLYFLQVPSCNFSCGKHRDGGRGFVFLTLVRKSQHSEVTQSWAES